MRHEKLIFLTGYFGAGKTTMARAAIENIPNLEYFRTTTTRPPRLEDVENQSIEYRFVNDEEYRNLMVGSQEWDDGELEGFRFGADVSAAKKLMGSGTSLLRCVLPDKAVIDRISSKFSTARVLVWLDTPLSTSNKRLIDSKSELRQKRIGAELQNEQNTVAVRASSDYLFTPTNSLEKDKKRFVDFLRKIIDS